MALRSLWHVPLAPMSRCVTWARPWKSQAMDKASDGAGAPGQQSSGQWALPCVEQAPMLHRLGLQPELVTQIWPHSAEPAVQ